ncbi:MAG: nucleotidyltransferase domain-containing protein [Trueperaceae bacterium]
MQPELGIPHGQIAGELDAELLEAVASLVRDLQPEQVILFGSRARGTQSKHSDLDLFIVMETAEKPLDRVAEVMHHMPLAPEYGIDIIVYRPDELAERRDSPFIRRILREGVVLYQREETP